MNIVTLLGNIGNAPEIKYLDNANGTCIAEFSICVQKYNYKTKQNEPNWIKCKALAKQAELIGEYFNKGSKIAIVGQIITDSWKNEAGEPRTKTYVLIDSFEFVEKKQNNEATASQELIGDDEIPL